jgi:hypothetical protein
MSADTQTQERTLEDRVASLEALIGRALAAAEAHPVGRRILRMMGLGE